MITVVGRIQHFLNCGVLDRGHISTTANFGAGRLLMLREAVYATSTENLPEQITAIIVVTGLVSPQVFKAVANIALHFFIPTWQVGKPPRLPWHGPDQTKIPILFSSSQQMKRIRVLHQAQPAIDPRCDCRSATSGVRSNLRCRYLWSYSSAGC
jgi:hypothetical protein